MFLAGITCQILAQKGTVRGTVIDDETGEPLIGVNVVKAESTIGTTTDVDGNYSLSLDAGTHSLVFSYVSYTRQVINEVEVKAGEVTVVQVRLKAESESIDEVVVTAKSVTNTESALMTIQKKSANVIDGISSQAFERSGDGNAAAALTRVTGVSVEGGKHVFVRGLGDRYTKTILNSMEIPGLDPDRNTVQMDLFPTNLIDNLIVYKSFSPDLPGDFTGGMVDIVTKDFPEKKTFSVSASFGYNPDMHFKDNFILYDGSSADWVAFGKPSRELHFNPSTKIPDPVLRDPKLHDLTTGFDTQMATEQSTSLIDQGYSISLGNQINKKKATWGYNLVMNYSSEYEFYEKVSFGSYQKSSDETIYELEPLKTASGPLGIHEVLWSGLASGAVKFEKHKISFMAMHIQNGQKRAADLQQTDFYNNATLIKDNLEYTQRGITNGFIAGKHHFNKLEMEWKNSVTYSQIDDPDLRTTAFSIRGEDTTLNSGDGAQITRIYRDLNELNESFKTDFTFPFKQWSGLECKFKFGLANTYKTRNYEILNYNFYVEGMGITGDPDWLFLEENIWMADTRRGTYVTGNSEKANTFDASSNVFGVYVMNELPLHQKVKAIYGLRLEKADHFYTGQNSSGSILYSKEKVLDELDFLPSFSLVYTVIKDMNLRLSYSRTVARPSFRENSIAQIYDPIQDRTYIGGIDQGSVVKESHIDNVDLRWEYFFRPGEIVALSGFYKHFQDPIEIVAFELNPSNVQPRNVGDGTVFGAELEVRKNFSFINEKLKDLSAGANVTYVYSRIKMSDEEYEGSTGSGGRLGNARDEEIVDDTRVMLGQSPFIVNAYLNYSSAKLGLDANLSYNVQGKRLVVVGSGRVPDVYETPFHSLNFKISKTLGKNKRGQISFSAENLIGDEKEKIYESFRAEHRIYELYTPGRTFSLGFSYTLK